MGKWFECVIKYEKTSETGSIVKVTESYLVDALSFTEAEARITDEMHPFISGEFEVAKIFKVKINELVFSEDGDKWYKCHINFITLDEDKGVERKTKVIMYIQSSSLKEARDKLEIAMKGTMADYDNAAISETKIIDVYRYSEN